MRLRAAFAPNELMTENMDSRDSLNARLRRSMADICRAMTWADGRRKKKKRRWRG
jgi:hypothetical protein